MYVDDVLSGVDSAEDAKLIVRELKSALDSAGFHKQFLAHIQSDHLLTTDILEIDTESTANEFFFVHQI